MERHLRWQRWLGLFLMGIMICTIWGAYRSPVAAVLAKGGRVPVLVFGIDAADASQHTDTLMLSVMDPFSNSLSLLSIPRDTKIKLPGYLFNRINEVYGYHMRKTHDPNHSSLEVKKAVETILSPADMSLSIPHFIQVDYSGFTKMVDLVGGVWVSIKNPMHYDDNAGGYHFHKEPGRFLMKGQEALFYVRYRGPTGDRGRIYRQQEFLRNMAKRMANPLTILRFPEMATAIAESVRTDLSFWDMVYLIEAGRRLRSNNIRFYIAPGRPRGAYWILLSDAVTRLAAHLIMGRPMSEEFAQTIVPQAEEVTVAVWNASGKKDLAYKITKYLRKAGYDVVDWGTYATRQIPSRVIDRRGKIMNAQAVARDMGIENVHSEPNAKILVDVEVVIGEDFNSPINFDEQ
jgi:polyisoprenyl-teichoic acid--peptidoglycan teichoic acid transferase